MRNLGPNLDLAALPSGHDRLAAASADNLTAASMCSDWTTTHVLSYLVRGADIGRNARFVNEQMGAGRERTRPDRRGHVVRRGRRSARRLAARHRPHPRLHRRACPDLDDLRRAFPGN